MNDDVVPESSLDVEQHHHVRRQLHRLDDVRGAPTPAIVWLPGTALLCIGPWMVTDGGLSLGWWFCAVGLAMVIIGAVAQGVAWGMDIHKERHP